MTQTDKLLSLTQTGDIEAIKEYIRGKVKAYHATKTLTENHKPWIIYFSTVESDVSIYTPHWSGSFRPEDRNKLYHVCWQMAHHIGHTGHMTGFSF